MMKSLKNDVQVTSLSLVSNMQVWIASLARVNVRVVAFKFSGLSTFFIPFRFHLQNGYVLVRSESAQFRLNLK